MANNFLPFCPTDTGTNLLSQGDYAVAPDRTNGNQPGIASSKLVNKAVRQSSMVTSQLAQYLEDRLGVDILDNGVTAQLLAQINAAMKPLPPNFTKYTTGSGNWNMQYYFFIASGSATAGATYTNNTVTFTVVETVASGVLIKMTGNGDPAMSGTLTKASGTGDATLTFYAMRKPVLLKAQVVGGGGSGAGGGQNGTASAGSSGNSSSFGSLVAGGGGPGRQGGSGPGGAGGTNTFSGRGFEIPGGGGGGAGSASGTAARNTGGAGGNTYFGGGRGGTYNAAGSNGATNSGAGGGGGGNENVGGISGTGGGGGGYIEAYIPSPSSTYAYAVAAAQTSVGGAGTSGFAGGQGAAGMIFLTEEYQ